MSEGVTMKTTTFPDGTTWAFDAESLTITCDGAGGSAPAGSWTFPNETDATVAWVTVLTK